MKRILLLLLLPIISYSQTLDTSFDGDGIAKIKTSDSPTTQSVYDAALQADGKIIYAGYSPFNELGYFLARYNSNGSKDNTFNQYGFKKYTHTTFQTLQVQNDGKIVTAGRTVLSRMLANGDLDTEFNSTGSLSVALNTQGMNIKCISFQPDGQIIVSGFISNGTNNDFAIARINSNGTLDSTFDGDGISLIPFGAANDQAYSHKILADGKILVFGETHNGTDYDFALARLNTNGTLDTGFGANGKVITSFGVGNDNGITGDVLSNGIIVMFGSSNGKFAFARYAASNGSPYTPATKTLTHDITFASTTFNTTLQLLPKLKILSDGQIMVSGTSLNDYKIIKLNPDLTYDSSFGTGGVTTVNIDTDRAAFLLEKTNGNILTGGYSYNPALFGNQIRQIELGTSGNIVSNTVKNLYTSFDKSIFGNGVIQLSDQSYLTLSTSYIAGLDRLILQKFSSNGIRDVTFGGSGYADLGNYGYSEAKIVELADGKIITVNDPKIIKLNSNGTYDTAFGTGGQVDITALGDGRLIFIDDFTLSNDNKVLIAADYTISNPYGNSTTAVVKLNLDGTLDSAFGTNGVVYYRFNADVNAYSEFPNTIYQDAANKIIVASISRTLAYPGNSPNINLAKLNENGTFDTSFGTNGKFIYPSGSDTVWTYRIMSSGDNNYLLNIHDTSTSHTLKITANGSAYAGFGTNGLAHDISGSDNLAMTIQPDGKILKGGARNNQFSISRYNTDGSVDPSFGSNGEINTAIDFQSNIQTVALQTDGKLFAVGNSFDGTKQVLTLARYTGVYLGTIDFSSEKKILLVYPNPIENNATFEYTLENNENVTVEIIDLQGKVVKRIITNKNQKAGKQTLPFSLEGMSAGQYILKIASGKGSQSVQLLKK